MAAPVVVEPTGEEDYYQFLSPTLLLAEGVSSTLVQLYSRTLLKEEEERGGRGGIRIILAGGKGKGR